ncbi:MAG: hypothetical protein O4861_08655 [Trichodesmium sp. St16_bin4-tuft]|nr:hypothetical protein [Trichodesmium sp. MAG_R01]MDE5068725.1 hypothetical protein [Trichodesmium sp. St4_bin8_1]MDE5070426.1 hypothetical protein [Trichodesmium sp. St5_bin8]MDE5078605.1 hypothetical protein [Trichodesmium sp. St2_bin6]MDE5091753.1 hypothetical protein [Trichodesmium sp. St18_bin3_1_1]MDE5098398.1 hypothetical protein [Trichodesmium sp. St16_bin4-tuft]MDE5105200.1 hypothetical protein [Trichodesmium sp. St19_bin2]
MPLIPYYLIPLIIILVIIPSFVAILLRMVLYFDLANQEDKVKRLISQQLVNNKPKFIKYLEDRFADASSKLEQVNTGALIDQVYSRQRLLGLVSLRQIEYFCRILPNLLVSFGLLGTFAGITINLTSLSQTISDTNATDVSSLLKELEVPLKGMGIAFVTSLVAILFSALVTLINLIFNASLAKTRLISLLEDYLDNIYLQTIQGQTQLDKVVKTIAYSFEEFLTTFGQTVRVGVESALQDKIQEIYNANATANKLAEQTFVRLGEAAATIANSSQDFQIASDKFLEVAQIFEHSQFPQSLANSVVELANIQSNFSQSTSTLAAAVQAIEIVVIELQGYSKRLARFGEQISNNNQTSLRILESHQSNQKSFAEVIRQLQEASQSFHLAVGTLDTLQRRVVSKADNLEEVQIQIKMLVDTFNNSTDGIGEGIKYLGDQINQGISTQANLNNSHLSVIATNLQKYINEMNATKNKIDSLTQIIDSLANQ